LNARKCSLLFAKFVNRDMERRRRCTANKLRIAIVLVARAFSPSAVVNWYVVLAFILTGIVAPSLEILAAEIAHISDGHTGLTGTASTFRDSGRVDVQGIGPAVSVETGVAFKHRRRGNWLPRTVALCIAPIRVAVAL